MRRLFFTAFAVMALLTRTGSVLTLSNAMSAVTQRSWQRDVPLVGKGVTGNLFNP